MNRKMHSLRNTAEYSAWHNMKKRCHSASHPDFRSYGAKGIIVCPAWRSDFTAFYADLGPRPSPSHSLDRIDNSKGYSPENCRWATKSEQSWNRNKPSNNSSGFKGVSFHKASNRWRATIAVAGITFRLGEFKHIEDAISARMSAENILVPGTAE